MCGLEFLSDGNSNMDFVFSGSGGSNLMNCSIWIRVADTFRPRECLLDILENENGERGEASVSLCGTGDCGEEETWFSVNSEKFTVGI